MESSIPSSRIITNEKEAVQFLTFLMAHNPIILLEEDSCYSPSPLLQANLLNKSTVFSVSSFCKSVSAKLIVVVSPLSYPFHKQSIIESKRSLLLPSSDTPVKMVFVVDAWSKMWAEGLSQKMIEILNPRVLIVGSSLEQVSILARTLQLEEDAFNMSFEADLAFTMQHRVARNLAPSLHKSSYEP